MRSRDTIEREIYQARDDLETRLAELRRLVANKVDIKARAQAALAEKRQQARELARRGADRAGVAYHRAAVTVREQPALFGAITGLLLAGVAMLLIVRHYRRPWYERW